MTDTSRLALMLALAGSVVLPAQDDEARRQLLPTGKLRVGLNTNNRITLAVGADIGRDLARRLGVEAVLVEYPSPGAVTDAAGTEWDTAFVAADPDREAAIAFTPPYVELDATYLVRGDSPVHGVGDVDRAGVRIATGATSAYTLLLKRDIRNATLVFLANDEAVEGLRAGTIDAVAGLRDALVRSAPRVPGARVLTGNITRARQAIAVPKANAAALAYLTQYLAEIKKSGFVAASIDKTGAIGVSIVQ